MTFSDKRQGNSSAIWRYVAPKMGAAPSGFDSIFGNRRRSIDMQVSPYSAKTEFQYFV
jgi:hypothetical protein